MKWISSLKTRTKLNDNVLYSEYLTDTRYINLHSSKVTYLGVYGSILCSSAWPHHKTRANFFTPCLFIPHLFGRSPLTECSSCNLVLPASLYEGESLSFRNQHRWAWKTLPSPISSLRNSYSATDQLTDFSCRWSFVTVSWRILWKSRIIFSFSYYVFSRASLLYWSDSEVIPEEHLICWFCCNHHMPNTKCGFIILIIFSWRGGWSQGKLLCS